MVGFRSFPQINGVFLCNLARSTTPNHVSVFSTTEINRQTKAEKRAAERELERARKRAYRDLRWSIDRYPITAQEWEQLLTLHQEFGKEGFRQLAYQLIPGWCLCQERIPGGTTIPAELWERYKPEDTVRTSTRKVRSDAGRARK